MKHTLMWIPILLIGFALGMIAVALWCHMGVVVGWATVVGLAGIGGLIGLYEEVTK